MIVAFKTQFTQLKKGVRKNKGLQWDSKSWKDLLKREMGKEHGKREKENVGAKKTNGIEDTDRVTVQVRFNSNFCFPVER